MGGVFQRTVERNCEKMIRRERRRREDEEMKLQKREIKQVLECLKENKTAGGDEIPAKV